MRIAARTLLLIAAIWCVQFAVKSIDLQDYTNGIIFTVFSGIAAAGYTVSGRGDHKPQCPVDAEPQ